MITNNSNLRNKCRIFLATTATALHIAPIACYLLRIRPTETSYRLEALCRYEWNNIYNNHGYIYFEIFIRWQQLNKKLKFWIKKTKSQIILTKSRILWQIFPAYCLRAFRIHSILTYGLLGVRILQTYTLSPTATIENV